MKQEAHVPHPSAFTEMLSVVEKIAALSDVGQFCRTLVRIITNCGWRSCRAILQLDLCRDHPAVMEHRVTKDRPLYISKTCLVRLLHSLFPATARVNTAC